VATYHTYPKRFLERPQLIRWVYLWNDLLLQRNWYLKTALRNLISDLPDGALVIDAGSGEGHHVFKLSRRFPKIRFLGLDILSSNIEFTKRLKAHYDLKNVEFRQADITTFTPEEKAAAIFSIGVLQLVPNDEVALKQLFDALLPEGKLLLYLPVNERVILPFLKKIKNELQHYDKVQHTQRVYTQPILFEKLKKAGFSIEKSKYTVGFLGTISHEVYNTFLILADNTPKVWLKRCYIIAVIMLIPYLLLLKVVDFWQQHETGNGTIIVARKA
jgi:SAM-dependent methyltransferase